MISELNIKTDLYKLLNKSALISVLNGGGVFKENRPNDSVYNDIVINVNSLQSKYSTGVSFGLANINIYSKALQVDNSVSPVDSLFLENTFNKLIEILEPYKNTSTDFYTYNDFNFSISNTQVFNELQKNEWFYLNIALNVQNNN